MKLPQLHLRDLFWLVLVVALAVGWWIDHLHAANRREAVIVHAERIRTVLDDARSAYVVSVQNFDRSRKFQGARGFLLPQEPDWGVADKSLDELAAMQ